MLVDIQMDKSMIVDLVVGSQLTVYRTRNERKAIYIHFCVHCQRTYLEQRELVLLHLPDSSWTASIMLQEKRSRYTDPQRPSRECRGFC